MEEASRLLVVCTQDPYGHQNGITRPVREFVATTSRRMPVVVVHPGSGADSHEEPPAGVSVIALDWRPRRRSRWAAALRGYHPSAAPFLDRRARSVLSQTLATERPDAVVAFLAPALAAFPVTTRIPLICMAHDALASAAWALGKASASWRHRSAAGVTALLLWLTERRLLRRADAVGVVSEEEASKLGRSSSPRRIFVAALGTDVVGDVPAIEERAPDLCFFGDFLSTRNEMVVRDLMDLIVPEVKQAVPETSLRVAGRAPAQLAQDLERDSDVVYLGYVDDLAEVMGSVRVLACYDRISAGTKNSLLLAMSHGVPVVVTPKAASGLGGRAGEDYVVAEDPQRFADECARLLLDADHWKRISASGRRLVAERFTWDGYVRAIFRVIAETRETRRS